VVTIIFMSALVFRAAIRCRYVVSLSRVSSVDLVQTNGFGFSFQWVIQSQMSYSRAWIDRCALPRRVLSVSSPNRRSTWLSHDE
jgi:hypothetical protein